VPTLRQSLGYLIENPIAVFVYDCHPAVGFTVGFGSVGKAVGILVGLTTVGKAVGLAVF
jgi:hypothetical protein